MSYPVVDAGMTHFYRHSVSVHGSTVLGSSKTMPVALRTPAEQWAYSVSFRRAALVATTRMLGIRVTVAVTAGRIGIGCLDAGDAAFIDEEFLDQTAGPATVELLGATPGDTGSLVIRNASADGASLATVLDVQCFDIDQPDEDHAPLSHPSAMPDWSQYYGTRGKGLAEKLRVRRFERLDAPTVLEWSDGLRFNIAPGNQLSRALYVSGTYEPNTLRVLRALLAPGATFLDVGANVGVVSLTAARWVGPQGRVFSFEPSRREFDRLTEHAALNGAINVTPVRAAVAARAGELMLRVADEAHGGLNTLGDRFAYDGVETARLEPVDAIALDDFVERQRIDRVSVIKLDIEGAEGAALEGATSVLRTHRPALVIEVCARALAASGWSAPRLDGLLRGAGYARFGIDDATGTLVALEDLAAADEQNIVALPVERAEQIREHLNDPVETAGIQ